MAVPEAPLRAAYVDAHKQFLANEEQRRNAAEVEFSKAFENADDFFDHDSGFDVPEPPRYAQHEIKITAGAGKTHAAAARLVADSSDEDRQFMYAVPTHEKAEEIAALANKMAGGTVAALWRGFERDDPGALGVKMCPRSDVARDVMEAGGSISDLCGSKQRGFCPFHPAVGGACGYRRQMELKPKIWVFAHALLEKRVPAAMESADALIVDEARSFGARHEDELPLSDLTTARKQRSGLDTLLPRVAQVLNATAPGDFFLVRHSTRRG